MSFRVSPRFKTLLNAAAAKERRSLTNMLETLLFDYCKQHGLEETKGLSEDAAEKIEGAVE
ncbi:hypothetical protein [Alcaligenes aquatilis]|uniref:hypothetical protein n=1 Tax=Alcaligenes aquatilis TaxID=323284 RepID=UPI003D25CF1A